MFRKVGRGGGEIGQLCREQKLRSPLQMRSGGYRVPRTGMIIRLVPGERCLNRVIRYIIGFSTSCEMIKDGADGGEHGGGSAHANTVGGSQ